RRRAKPKRRARAGLVGLHRSRVQQRAGHLRARPRDRLGTETDSGSLRARREAPPCAVIALKDDQTDIPLGTVLVPVTAGTAVGSTNGVRSAQPPLTDAVA